MARRKAWDFSRLLPAQLIWPWSNSFLVMMPKRQLLFRFFSAYFRKPQQISQTLVKKNAPAPLRLWRMQRGLKRASPLTQCNRFILKCFTNNVHSCRLQLAICFFSSTEILFLLYFFVLLSTHVCVGNGAFPRNPWFLWLKPIFTVDLKVTRLGGSWAFCSLLAEDWVSLKAQK